LTILFSQISNILKKIVALSLFNNATINIIVVILMYS
jgi:hypothetical protein